MREIEIKVRLRDMEALEQKLREKGVVLSTPIHQHDTVYSKNGTAEFESAKQGETSFCVFAAKTTV